MEIGNTCTQKRLEHIIYNIYAQSSCLVIIGGATNTQVSREAFVQQHKTCTKIVGKNTYKIK